MEQEEEEHRKALQIQEEELRLEMERVAEKGYQEKVNILNYTHPEVSFCSLILKHI